MDSIRSLPFYFWPLLAAVLLSQSLWIYLDARKRGDHKFLWGFFGLLNCPSSLLVYLLVTRILVKTKACPACGKRMVINSVFCPHCGEPQGKAKEKG
jgi:hypothetical protein